ncbi:ROK family protein [Actinomadura luteofluorescens]|uniref:ROK family protein n=1 Tax=Actinomadura luteofluorescens TaxID=46163 RepID=UPI00362C7F05
MADRTSGGTVARDLRIGVDVGGTNTDAVVLSAKGEVLARTKQATSADVSSGLHTALTAVLDQLGDDVRRVGRVMLGTTHATNAILERRGLGKVAAIRLGGPATTSVPPAQSWPRTCLRRSRRAPPCSPAATTSTAARSPSSTRARCAPCSPTSRARPTRSR